MTINSPRAIRRPATTRQTRIVDLPVECHEASGSQLLHRIAIERSRPQFDRDGRLDRDGILSGEYLFMHDAALGWRRGTVI
ncbi:MAG: hypothetical protein Ct9H300mP1_05380 [Planctomycetaceae bacterium]|nr:MAG: hypothetical protein Ct9H300mP1_05380 [Planctomycetaceae bacterium]